jgi:ribA/ribD-fused uncharacterized protein
MNAGENNKIYFDQNHDTFGALTNESPFAVRIEEITWPTVCHYLLGEEYPEAVQAGLRLTCIVEEAHQLISSQNFARRHKWEAQKDDYLYRALSAKFVQHVELEQLLLGTGSAELIFASQDDWYNGIGSKGVGYNMLGRLLMRVRRNLVRFSLDYIWGEGTVSAFEQVEAEVEADPTDAHAISRLAEAYLAIGKPEFALLGARRALAVSNLYQEWNHRTLVLSLFAMGMLEEAIEPIKHLMKLDPKDPDYLKWLAKSLNSLGKEIPAKVYARRARLLEEAKQKPSDEDSDA